MNTVDIKTFYNELADEPVEKFVVREIDDNDRVIRTRLVQTMEDAQIVRHEWLRL